MSDACSFRRMICPGCERTRSDDEDLKLHERFVSPEAKLAYMENLMKEAAEGKRCKVCLKELE